MKPIMSVSGLGKQYRIGRREAPYATLRESLTRAAFAPVDRIRRVFYPHGGNARAGEDQFWALKDVDFEVHPGEAIGIIGRNGAGKSTLLKILSRVTEPTAGRVELYGRVGSLLEVGTGFHPELTGQENIYLNGAILGMSRREITRKLDEIVAFAEIERFVDTPVKRYSSGMYMRLAFAVAAHLEPEILVVDEVLAVGDATFQKKCLGRLSAMTGEGRTVLFVSHNIGAIAALCTRSLMLQNGSLVLDSDTITAIEYYHSTNNDQLDFLTADKLMSLETSARRGTGKGRFLSARLTPQGPDNLPFPYVYPSAGLKLDVVIRCHTSFVASNAAMIIYDQNGYRVIDANTALKGHFLSLATGEEALVSFELQDVLLRPGNYTIGLWLGRDAIEEIDHVESALRFSVETAPEASTHTQLFPGIYQCRFDVCTRKI